MLGVDGVVTWTLGTVIGASNGKRTLTVDVDPLLDDGAILRAIARIDDNAGSRAEASADTRVDADSPLTLTLSLAPDAAAPGAAITGTLVVGNIGAQPAQRRRGRGHPARGDGQLLIGRADRCDRRLRRDVHGVVVRAG